MDDARILLDRISRFCVAAIEPVEVDAPWRDPMARRLLHALWGRRPGS